MLKTDRSSIEPDGRDVAVVTVEIQDSKGRVVPDACPLLHFSLQGDARILGVGNGDPAYLGQDNPNDPECRQFSIPAFNGLAQVLVQSGKTPGQLRISATADKLKGASLVIRP